MSMLWLTWGWLEFVSREEVAVIVCRRGNHLVGAASPSTPGAVPSSAVPTVTAALLGISHLLICLLSAVTYRWKSPLKWNFSAHWGLYMFDGVLFLSPLPSLVLFFFPAFPLALSKSRRFPLVTTKSAFHSSVSLRAGLHLLFCSQAVGAVSFGSCVLI